MADKKISQLTNLTGANLAENDEFVLVDTSADETKAITFGELKTAFDTGTGFVRVTGDTMTGDLSFNGGDTIYGDNDKAIFGAGSDLQIYHSGSNSHITEGGTGNLIIRADDFRVQSNAGEEYIAADANGAVSLRYDNATKLATTSTGIDVTGTVTADGLTVDGAASAQIVLNEGDTTNLNTRIINNTGKLSTQTWSDAGGLVGTRMLIDHSTGDISFYEDTGTTPKFFWDASAEKLGIGTAAPAAGTQLEVNAATDATVRIGNTVGQDLVLSGGASGVSLLTPNALAMTFSTSNTERMRIDSSGNVGIGTSSPWDTLSIPFGEGLSFGSATYPLTISRSPAGELVTTIADGYDSSSARIDFVMRQGAAAENTALSITGSGKVGIGTTSPTYRLEVSGDIAQQEGNVRNTISSTGTGFEFTANANSLNVGRSFTFSSSTSGGSVQERMRIDSSGNVTVNSNGSVAALDGISGIQVGNSAATTAGLALETSNRGYLWYIGSGTSNLNLWDSTANSDRLTIDSSGKVGIGTNSPAYNLVVSAAGASGIEFGPAYSGTANLVQHYSRSGGVYVDAVNDAAQHRFNTSGTERMRIDSSGNVGIGVAPENSSGTWRNFEQGGMNMAARSSGAVDGMVGTNYVFKTDNSEVYKTTGAASRLFFNDSAMQFQIAASGTAGNAISWDEAMRIDSSGNLLVGTTTNYPSFRNSKFVSEATGTDISAAFVSDGASATQTVQIINQATSGTRIFVEFRAGAGDGTQVGSITTDGTTTAYNTSSDYRLKTDAQPMTGASARVQALKPVNFEWISTGERVDGFLAHELQTVVPEAATGTKDAVDADGNPEYQGIDQSKLVPLLTAALQEALTKIDALETRITALEG